MNDKKVSTNLNAFVSALRKINSQVEIMKRVEELKTNKNKNINKNKYKDFDN